ncbi:S8 family peptidase [Glycomyces algeriensis]|uniref:Peptidase S8 n=1 Tax=Glycomyces algeriensis TaxID=256037 RepID=A0A9W6LFB3_9ACTN|nr:S8/S53 family peptidase [Glycomyces algeriensis]MDA1366145.1 S8/S53 family peptidase [Glycomyces algeriensis]MDR7349087.1 subtilisin family serine protease [Glycomyces algeriensis]GLI41787.1 peptidase S8 [Glycomyces algeriensis]
MRLVFADHEPHLKPNPRRDHMSGVPELSYSTLDRHGGRVLAPGQVVRTAGQSAPVGTIYRYDRLLVDESVIHDTETREQLEEAIRPTGMLMESQAASSIVAGQGSYRVPVLSTHGDQAAVDAWSLLQRLRTVNDESSLPGDLLDKVRLEHLMICSKVTPGVGSGEPPIGDSRSYGLGRIPVDMVNPMPDRKQVGRRLRVAILDTGVPTKHPAFDVSDRTEGEDTFVVVDHAFQAKLGEHSDSPAIPLDDPWEGPVHEPTLVGEVASHYGHGTFMTGLLRQMSPDVQVYSLKVVHNDGLAYEHEVIGALHHVADQVEAARGGDTEALIVDAVVLAMGYVDESPDDEPGGWIGDAVHRLAELGIPVVAAAGNQSSDRPFYPAAFAAYPQSETAAPILSVGALNPNRHIAMFSNEGPWVSCYATGAGLVSTYPCEAKGSRMPDRRAKSSILNRHRESHDPDDFSSGFAVWSGTSFAAPLAAAFLMNALAESEIGTVNGAAEASARAHEALKRLKKQLA